MKELFLKVVRSLPIGPVSQETLLFFLKLGYWPDLNSPRTFNEKINYRKLFATDDLTVRCTDKIAVRDYVAEKIGEKYLIPLLYKGKSITAEALHELGDNIVAKPSHDSKSTEIIRLNTPEVAAKASVRLRAKLKTDYGKTTNQFAYSKVSPRILVERMLVEEDKPTPDDYKIFCFRQPDGTIKKFIEVHKNRDQPEYKVTWYDDGDLTPILLRGSIYETCPFPIPEAWDEMRIIAETFAREFDHVRVDLYFANGQIYFGELTFFDGGGRTEYSRAGAARHDLDREMGRLWNLEPIGSSC